MRKLFLKLTNKDDYDEYYRIRCSPADIYWNGYLSKPDYENFKQIFSRRTGENLFQDSEDRRIYLIGLQENTNLKYIGFIQLIHRGKYIEIGYTIIEEYQRKGFATEALQKAVPIAKRIMEKVIVRIRDDNYASQRVAQKCGFSKTDEYIENEYPIVGKIKLRTYII